VAHLFAALIVLTLCGCSNQGKQSEVNGWVAIREDDLESGMKEHLEKDTVILADAGRAFLRPYERSGRTGLYPVHLGEETSALIPLTPTGDLYMFAAHGRVYRLLLLPKASLDLPPYPQVREARGLIVLGEGHSYHASGRARSTGEFLSRLPLFEMDVETFGAVPEASTPPPMGK
jgi:hypothetical protein